MSHKKLIIAFLSIILIVLIGIIASLLIKDGSKNATLNLLIVPTDAKTTVNGKEYENGSYRFSPGTIEVSISKEGFETQNFSVSLESNKTTLVYRPLPCEDSSFVCYLDDEKNLELLSYVANYSNRSSEIQNFTRKAAITKILPINYESYDDDYSKHYLLSISLNKEVSDENTIVLTVTDYTGISQSLATQILKESGFNPSDYTINYKSGIDPLIKGYSGDNE